MSSILGGFLGTAYTSSGYNDGSVATNRGVITRFNPGLDPGNIPVRGTGERGLYDILLGRRDPRFTIDILPTDATWIAAIQDGQTATSVLHLKFVGGEGLSFIDAYINRLSLEARATPTAEAINSTMEFWSGGDATYPVGIIDWEGSPPNQSWGARVTTPKRWLDSVLSIATVTETQWWTWRYEVVNNLQRLTDVTEGSTRALKARHRDVTGLITKDLEDFDEWRHLANVAAEQALFNITITLAGTTLFNCDRCRWGNIEGPSGPEDLIAKRLPFTATDLTTLTP
jgi:hypothetical protein